MGRCLFARQPRDSVNPYIQSPEDHTTEEATEHAPHAEGAGWAAAMRHMTRAASKGLGVVEGCNVEARLYKLLVG